MDKVEHRARELFDRECPIDVARSGAAADIVRKAAIRAIAAALREQAGAPEGMMLVQRIDVERLINATHLTESARLSARRLQDPKYWRPEYDFDGAVAAARADVALNAAMAKGGSDGQG